MRRTTSIVIACLALGLAAGCGDDDDESGGSSGGGGLYGAPAASGEEIVIKMKDTAFSPQTVKAKVGQTIEWVNEDTIDHNVVGGDLKSDTFGEGGTYSYTLKEAGSISYECTLHPGMTGTIDVS
jgi:plastocyanin